MLDLSAGEAASSSGRPMRPAHGDAVHHLLVELGVGFGGAQTALCQQADVVQVHRLVTGSARRIDVNNLEVFADRAWPQVLPGDFERELVDRGGLETGGEAGIECKDPKPAGGGALCHSALSGCGATGITGGVNFSRVNLAPVRAASRAG